VFFFQAEDGIRDKLVTGVQTCALPIFIFNVTFLIWQAPPILAACMKDPTLYQWQLLTIFLASLLNWWPLIGSVHEVRRLSYPLRSEERRVGKEWRYR